MKKPITLKQFRKKMGASLAAYSCRVSTVTYWRWETGRTKPKGNDARRLVELGVKIS